MDAGALLRQGGEGSAPYVSVIIPIFNEADNLQILHQRLCSAMEETGYSWEAVYVNDGSTDGSGALLRRLHGEGETVRVVDLTRNFGQTAAMAAGFDHARGEIIVAMDGDLQNDPGDIPRLVEKLGEGFDVVSGWRANRQDGFWLRRLPSQAANWLISKTTGTHLHDYGCTLKAYRRDAMKHLKLYGEMHRFIPAILAGYGARIVELPVAHHARQFGKSKYGISRTVRVLLDLLLVKFTLSFMTKPLQIFGLVGLMSFLPGVAICAVLLFQRIVFFQALGDRPLFLLGILLTVIGAQFVSLGILAEIQIRTYHEASHKPTYLIRNILNPCDVALESPDSDQATGSPNRNDRPTEKTFRTQNG
jgi:glycosyltransferase involved in cell wall biosynthesis